MADSAIWVKVYPAPPPSGSVTWAKVSGGTVTTYAKPDGSVMEVHTFTSSGDLIVQEDGYAEVLVVGGGGSGGRYANLYAGGGGGAGEVCHGNYLLPVGNVPVIVGAGGAAPTVDSRNGNRGESSSLGPIVCIGGGGGQGEANAGSTWNTSAFSGASAGAAAAATRFRVSLSLGATSAGPRSHRTMPVEVVVRVPPGRTAPRPRAETAATVSPSRSAARQRCMRLAVEAERQEATHLVRVALAVSVEPVGGEARRLPGLVQRTLALAVVALVAQTTPVPVAAVS